MVQLGLMSRAARAQLRTARGGQAESSLLLGHHVSEGPPQRRLLYLYIVTDIYSRRMVAARAYEAENDANSLELFVQVQSQRVMLTGRSPCVRTTTHTPLLIPVWLVRSRPRKHLCYSNRLPIFSVESQLQTVASKDCGALGPGGRESAAALCRWPLERVRARP